MNTSVIGPLCSVLWYNDNNNKNNFLCANILEDHAQWWP